MRTLDLGSNDAGRQRPDNALCDLVLDGKNILKPAVVLVGPDVMTGRRVDELSGDAHAIPSLPHAAFEHIAHAKLAADLPNVAVAGALDDAATMFRDRRLQQFTAVSVEPGECSFLVDTHEPAIAGDIPRQNGRKPPLDTLFGHRHAPPRAFH